MDKNFFNELSIFIGNEWIETELKKVPTPNKSKRLKAINQIQIHPYIYFLNSFYTAPSDNRMGTSNFWKFRYLQSQLPGIKQIPNVNRLKIPLKNKDEFWPTIAEMLLGHLLQGFKKDISYLSTDDQKKMPDMLINKNGNENIFVECKSLAALNEKRRQSTKQFPIIMNRVLKKLYELNKKLDVYIRFPGIPTENDVKTVIDNLENTIQSKYWVKTAGTSNIELWTKEILQTIQGGKGLTGSLPDVAHPYNSWFQVTSKVENLRFTRFYLVGMEIIADRIDLSNLESRVSSAIKQFDKKHSNVLALFLEEKPEEHDIEDYYWNWFRQKFDNNMYSRISSVLLFYLTREKIIHQLKFAGGIPLEIDRLRFHELKNLKAKIPYSCTM